MDRTLLVTLTTLLVGQWALNRQARRTGARDDTPLGIGLG